MKTEEVYKKLRKSFSEYITKSGLKSVVLGISGGIDSAIVAALFYDVCTECGIKLIGRSLTIQTNKEDEKHRADLIGQEFCHDYKHIILDDTYMSLLDGVEEVFEDATESDRQTKIRHGNIKARLRMMYLYNIAQLCGGMVLDTDNKTEHNLGFWTLHGDVGDYTPLIELWKCDVYDLSKYTISQLKSESAKHALQLCVDATPTDGLGITSSDVEQLGCKSYAEVDDVLKYITTFNITYLSRLLRMAKDKSSFRDFDTDLEELSNKYSYNSVIAILERHVNSNFKRNNPFHVKL